MKQLRIEGGLDLDELRLFVELPTVQQLDLREVQLREDPKVLLQSYSRVVVLLNRP